MSEWHIEAVGTFPIESAEAGLIEKEERGSSRNAEFVVALQCIESSACPVIEGFL